MGARRRLIARALGEAVLALRGRRRVYRVAGRSMAPTLLPDELLWVRASADLPSIGEVVVLRDETRPGAVLVKRVRSRGRATFAVGSDDPLEARDSRQLGSFTADDLVGPVLYAWSPARGLRAVSSTG